MRRMAGATLLVVFWIIAGCATVPPGDIVPESTEAPGTTAPDEAEAGFDGFPELPPNLPAATWRRVAEAKLGGNAFSLAVAGSYVYMGVGGVIEIIDVKDPLSPTVVGTLPGGHVLGAGDRLYLDRTRVYSLADPRAPEFLGEAPVELVALGDDEAVVQRPGESGYLIMEGTDLLAEAPTYPIPTETFPVSGWPEPKWWVVDVEVRGDLVYLLHWSGLQIVDVSSRQAPETVGATSVLANQTVQNGPALHALTVVGDTAYAAAEIGTDALRAFDVSDPAAPEEIVFYDPDAEFSGTVGVLDPGLTIGVDLAVAGDTAFVAGAGGLASASFSNGELELVTLVELPEWLYQFSTVRSGDYLYVSEHSTGLTVFDISDPTQPRRLGRTPAAGRVIQAVSRNDMLYVRRPNGLEAIDVASPNSPNKLGFAFIRRPQGRGGLAVSTNGAWVALADTLIDVSDPTEPRLVGTIPEAGFVADVAVNDSGSVAALIKPEQSDELELQVFETDGSTALQRTGGVTFPDYTRGSLGFVDDGRVVVMLGLDEVVELDVSAPGEIRELSRIDLHFDASTGYSHSFVARDGRAATADPLYLWDYSTPGDPRELLRFENEHGYEYPLASIAGGWAVLGALTISSDGDDGNLTLGRTPSRSEGLLPNVFGDRYHYALSVDGILQVLAPPEFSSGPPHESQREE